jgi:phospholipase/carboxylesterase
MAYVAKRTEGGQVLAFTFHGTGGDEGQFHGFAEQLLPGASVVSPRGDVSETGASRYFRRTGEGVYDMADLARRTEAMAAFISAEKARAEATRTVGLGYSNGANILSAVAFQHPDLVEELVLLHPLIPWEPAPQPGLAGRRVLITAGQRDPICPPPLTERLAKWFEAQGAEVTVAWHPGGHEIAQAEIAAIQRFLAPVAA